MAFQTTTVQTPRFALHTRVGEQTGVQVRKLVRLADNASVTIHHEDVEGFDGELASLEWCFPSNPLDWRLEQLFRSFYVAGVSR